MVICSLECGKWPGTFFGYSLQYLYLRYLHRDRSCATAAGADNERGSPGLPGVRGGPLHEQRGFKCRRDALPQPLPQLLGNGTGRGVGADP